ncbi:MAG: hypothetical protein NC340_01265 [Ruminococcus flavefaciens]|nr:hypothetical protein [Ruminococcus flavefaciens]MCM1228775.1 hypothetical protein [Ruminococcus flavefaciens]
MSEKLTDWQMIAGLYRKVAESTDISGQAVDLAVGTKLSFMVKEGAEAIASVTGSAQETADGYNYQLAIMRRDGNHYFVIFPDTETAAALGTGYTKCKVEELLRLIYNTPQMRGIQLVIDYDKETKKFVTGEITKNMAVIALGI